MHRILFLLFIVFIFIGCSAITKGNVDKTTSVKIEMVNATNETILPIIQATTEEKNMREIISCENETEKREKEACYDMFIEQKLAFKNPRAILEELDAAANTDTTLRLVCHDIAHGLGRIVYTKSVHTIPDAFKECTQTCHAGCYHGAIQAFFLGENYLNEGGDSHVTIKQMKEKVKAACTPFVENRRENFQCLHGMGHAIQYYVDNNLSISLSICDELGTSYGRESCYGGVFMENVVSVNTETRSIRFDSPLYPCTEMNETYKYQCYLMQTAIMLQIFGEDIDTIIETCMQADANYTSTCFKSLGRDRSNYIRIKSEAPYHDLEKIDKKYREDYIIGLTYALADNTWNGFYAFPFCSKLQDEGLLKDACYKKIIQYLAINLALSKENITDSCKIHAPQEDKTYCFVRVR